MSQADYDYEANMMGEAMPLLATQYLPGSDEIQELRGREMIGKPCPTCGSPLVKRVNGRSLDWFVACDKTFRSRCPFTVGWFETLKERTKRIEKSLLLRR